MAMWTDLPNEVISEILSHLPHAVHLKSTSLVCSRLRGASQRLLNKSVVVDTSGNFLPDDLRSGVENYEMLSKVVNYDPKLDGREIDTRQELFFFLSTLLAHPESFRSTRALRLKAARNQAYGDWIGKWELESGRVVLKEYSTQDHEGRKHPLSVDEDLMRGASSLGISQMLIDSAPSSVALLVILHMLPALRRLIISHPDTVLPTLTLASYGRLSGGIPPSLQNLEILKLGRAGLPPWRDHSPIPLLFALPNLQTFRCDGWHSCYSRSTYEKSPWQSLLNQVPKTASSAGSRLSRLTLKGRNILDPKELIQIIAMSENLQLLELEDSPPFFGRDVQEFDYEDGAGMNIPTPDVDYASLAKALKPHSGCLRSLTIRWDTKPEDFELPLLMYGVRPPGNLKIFTVLEHLAITEWALFDPDSFLGVEPGLILPSYLPSSLVCLEIFHGNKEQLFAMEESLQLRQLWPVVKSQSFPKLETFYLEHGGEVRGRQASVKLETLRNELADVGITIWPPRYLLFVSFVYRSAF